MSPADPYGVGDDELADLPPLPIPRPGEWSPVSAGQPPAEPRLAPPALGGGLGGGASFTASGDGEAAAPSPHPVSDAPSDPEWPHAAHEQLDSERFTWEIAARLTSGLLANPARGHATVKDAMGLFDQLLQEMNAYTKIASEFDLVGNEAARRRKHEEYFQHQRAGTTAQPNPEQPVPPAPASPPGPVPKPKPAQPRPMGDYRPIPPGSRYPYSPGSMAGTPPPEHNVGDDEKAA